MSTAIKSISLSLDMLTYVEKYKISLSEAVRVGLAVMLSDLGESQFLNRVNIGRKIENMSKVIEELSTKLEEFQNVVAKEK